jgi:hypothetical protein
MADKTNPELAQSDAVSQVDGSEQELEGEDALDDQNYSPEFIERLIKNPPLLPGENSYEFEQLFEHFENTHLGRAKSPTEYVLVANVTLLTWEVMRYYRIKASITVNQQRGAVESLFMKTHEGASMEGAAAGLRASASVSADAWFSDPAFRARAAKSFEAAGFAPDAVEAEAFQRSLPTLETIDRLIASAQKRLMSFLKDLERRYGSRGAEVRLLAVREVSRAAGEKK